MLAEDEFGFAGRDQLCGRRARDKLGKVRDVERGLIEERYVGPSERGCGPYAPHEVLQEFARASELEAGQGGEGDDDDGA